MWHTWTRTHCSFNSEISPNALKGWVQNKKPRFTEEIIEINGKLLHECYLTSTYWKRFELCRSTATLRFNVQLVRLRMQPYRFNEQKSKKHEFESRHNLEFVSVC
jgi:hypothetical protein